MAWLRRKRRGSHQIDYEADLEEAREQDRLELEQLVAMYSDKTYASLVFEHLSPAVKRYIAAESAHQDAKVPLDEHSRLGELFDAAVEDEDYDRVIELGDAMVLGDDKRINCESRSFRSGAERLRELPR